MSLKSQVKINAFSDVQKLKKSNTIESPLEEYLKISIIKKENEIRYGSTQGNKRTRSGNYIG